MDWIHAFIPLLETREALTWQSTSTVVLPSFFLYFLNAYLVLTPGTLYIRLALLPISLWSFFHTATRVDLVYGLEHRESLVYMNESLVAAMIIAAGRCITWSYQQVPYKRLQHIPVENGLNKTKNNRLLDALDLTINLRGLDWNWSRGLKIPPETRSTHSRGAFLLTTLVDFLKEVIIGDHLHWAIQWLRPTIASPPGGSIYNPSLPPIQNFFFSTFLSLLTWLLMYFIFQSAYQFFTLVGVGVFNQHPLQWPPVFESPWLATSLTEFWARRWHQIYRDMFISIGGKPLSMLAGRPGWVLGGFIISGTLHNFAVWGLGRGGEFSTIGGFFLIQSFGVILEHTWRYFIGSRVGGGLGRIWTFVWVVVWGRMIADAYCRKGLGASIFHQDRFRPSYMTLGKLPFMPA